MAVHPTAIVSPEAVLAADVEVGPCAVIEGPVKIGAGSRIFPHAYICGDVTMGEGNTVYPGAVIGTEPQDLSYEGAESSVRIGDGNTLREGVTIHRGTEAGSETVIGSDCYLMAMSHVAHNCTVGDNVILANCALLGGHVDVADRAFLSGGAVIHQFVRIGSHAFVSGNASISMDVPPYVTVRGRNLVAQVNKVGVRRSPHITEAGAKAIERCYRLLYRSGLDLTEAIDRISAEEEAPEAKALVDFIKSSERGICRPGRRKPKD